MKSFFLATKDGKGFLLSMDGRKYLAKLVRDDVYEIVDCKTCTIVGEFKTVKELLNKIKEEQYYEV